MLNFKMSIMALMLLAVSLLLVADDKPDDKDVTSRGAQTRPASSLVAGEKAKGKPQDNASEERIAKIVDQLTGQFAEVATAVKLNEKQAKDLLAIQKAMDKALVKWDRTSKKKIAATEAKIAKTKNAKIKARLEADMERFKAGRDRLEARYQRRAPSVLTPTQRGEYFGPKLWSAILQEFDAVNLDEAQKAKALKICKGLTKTARSDPATNRSLKTRACKMVSGSVLTKEQKKILARRKAPAKTVPSKKKRTRNK